MGRRITWWWTAVSPLFITSSLALAKCRGETVGDLDRTPKTWLLATLTFLRPSIRCKQGRVHPWLLSCHLGYLIFLSAPIRTSGVSININELSTPALILPRDTVALTACQLGLLIPKFLSVLSLHSSSRSTCTSTLVRFKTEGSIISASLLEPGLPQQSGQSGQDCPKGQFQWMSLLTSNPIFGSEAV